MITRKLLIIALLTTVTVGSVTAVYIINKSKTVVPVVEETQSQEEIVNEDKIEDATNEKQELADKGYDVIEFDNHIDSNQDEDYHDDDDDQVYTVTQEEVSVNSSGEIEVKFDFGNNETEMIEDKKSAASEE